VTNLGRGKMVKLHNENRWKWDVSELRSRHETGRGLLSIVDGAFAPELPPTDTSFRQPEGPLASPGPTHLRHIIMIHKTSEYRLVMSAQPRPRIYPLVEKPLSHEACYRRKKSVTTGAVFGFVVWSMESG